MSVLVRIPTSLRKYTGGKPEVDVEGASVRDAFDSLETRHKGIRDRVFDDSGAVRRFINVFLNGEDIRHMKGPDTTLKGGDELSIVPAIAGGAWSTAEGGQGTPCRA